MSKKLPTPAPLPAKTKLVPVGIAKIHAPSPGMAKLYPSTAVAKAAPSNGHAIPVVTVSKITYDDDCRLQSELETLTDKLSYERDLITQIEGILDGLKDQGAAALALLDDSTARLKHQPHPGSSDVRSDLAAAKLVMERCTEAQQIQERRLREAKARYAMWSERRSAFPMDRLREYKAKEAQRQRVLRSARTGFAEN